MGQTFIGEDEDDSSNFKSTSSESDNDLEDTVVPAQYTAVSEQDHTVIKYIILETSIVMFLSKLISKFFQTIFFSRVFEFIRLQSKKNEMCYWNPLCFKSPTLI